MRPLTVAELILALQQEDPTLPVLLTGYEAGWDPVLAAQIKVRMVAPRTSIDPWAGEFSEFSDTKKSPAVCIGPDRA